MRVCCVSGWQGASLGSVHKLVVGLVTLKTQFIVNKGDCKILEAPSQMTQC